MAEQKEAKALAVGHPQAADGQCRSRPSYGVSSDFDSTFTIHSPELMSGTYISPFR